MSGVTQATFMNQRSFGEPAPTVIGQAYGGGFYAGQIGVSGTATHYLVTAPKSSGETGNYTTTIKYKNANTGVPGAASDIDGPQNTADMVADGNSTVYPAAHFCNDLVIGAFTDWYMPARNELEVCYYNLKPGTQTNYTSSGINANSVPERTSNYTGGTPARTSATVFRTGNAEAFVESTGKYWASTEATNPFGALTQYFEDGRQSGTYYGAAKDNNYRVRAVRRVAV